MRSWPLPLQPRFIVYTAVVLITAFLLLEYLLVSRAFYVTLPLILFAALADPGVGAGRQREGRRRLELGGALVQLDESEERAPSRGRFAQGLHRRLAVGQGGFDVLQDGDQLRNVFLPQRQKGRKRQGRQDARHKNPEAGIIFSGAAEAPIPESPG